MDDLTPLDPDALKAQKRRNMWLGLGLGAFVVIVGMLTFLRLAENISNGAG